MNNSWKRKLLFWLNMVVVWIFAFVIVSYFRNFGWEASAATDFVPERTLSLRLNFMVGTIVGTLYSFIELFMGRRSLKRLPFSKWATIRAFLHLLLILILFLSAIFGTALFAGRELTSEYIKNIFFSENLFMVSLYFILVSTMITLFIQMNEKMGQGTFKNILLGKYHHPREEEAIFLFIDLQSSTTIAEKLGHLQFSSLIQDCFADITDAVRRHQAEIYQYVGDEVILSWTPKKGISKNNCIKAFFYFQDTLQQRGDYYQRQYGLEPRFKGGAHFGKVTVAEIGIIKKEIAYHGDVLNTTARLESKCNELDEQLVISQDLLERLSLQTEFDIKHYAATLLEGKTKNLSFVGVRRIL